jgi:hypothetical protein
VDATILGDEDLARRIASAGSAGAPEAEAELFAEHTFVHTPSPHPGPGGSR